MQKEIVVTIKGDIDSLLEAWTPPVHTQSNRTHDGLDLVLNADDIAEYQRLEDIIEILKLKHSIELITFFKAYDFTTSDLANSELLWMQVLWSSTLEVVGKEPIREYRCQACQQTRYEIVQKDCLHLKSTSPLKNHILSIETQILFHRDLIEMIRNKGFDSGLQTIPCSIVLGGQEENTEYSWIYSQVDLGIPIGHMEVGTPCAVCGIPEPIKNNSFIITFNRTRWHGEDFCTSTFFGPEFLYVSQRVFQMLANLSSELKGEVIFEPIDLI